TGVEVVEVITDRDTGRSRGFAFVQMATSEAADEAIRKFNGYELGGRTLKVEISKPSGSRGGGNYRSGGGYRAGGGSRGGGGNRCEWSGLPRSPAPEITRPPTLRARGQRP